VKNTIQITVLVAFTSLAAAHFDLDYLAARGFDEDTRGSPSPFSKHN
jgi:hypothetical protein